MRPSEQPLRKVVQNRNLMTKLNVAPQHLAVVGRVPSDPKPQLAAILRQHEYLLSAASNGDSPMSVCETSNAGRDSVAHHSMSVDVCPPNISGPSKAQVQPYVLAQQSRNPNQVLVETVPRISSLARSRGSLLKYSSDMNSPAPVNLPNRSENEVTMSLYSQGTNPHHAGHPRTSVHSVPTIVPLVQHPPVSTTPTAAYHGASSDLTFFPIYRPQYPAYTASPPAPTPQPLHPTYQLHTVQPFSSVSTANVATPTPNFLQYPLMSPAPSYSNPATTNMQSASMLHGFSAGFNVQGSGTLVQPPVAPLSGYSLPEPPEPPTLLQRIANTDLRCNFSKRLMSTSEAASFDLSSHEVAKTTRLHSQPCSTEAESVTPYFSKDHLDFYQSLVDLSFAYYPRLNPIPIRFVLSPTAQMAPGARRPSYTPRPKSRILRNLTAACMTPYTCQYACSSQHQPTSLIHHESVKSPLDEPMSDGTYLNAVLSDVDDCALWSSAQTTSPFSCVLALGDCWLCLLWLLTLPWILLRGLFSRDMDDWRSLADEAY